MSLILKNDQVMVTSIGKPGVVLSADKDNECFLVRIDAINQSCYCNRQYLQKLPDTVEIKSGDYVMVTSIKKTGKIVGRSGDEYLVKVDTQTHRCYRQYLRKLPEKTLPARATVLVKGINQKGTIWSCTGTQPGMYQVHFEGETALHEYHYSELKVISRYTATF